MAPNFCSLCNQSRVFPAVIRENLITMQNYVYQNRDDALQAKVGQFELGVCPDCGFANNRKFDSSLLNYDKNYDNSVPSATFTAYYQKIATFLHQTYNLDNQLVIDVGCGKGTFLKVLTDFYPQVRGLGIDPSYEETLLISKNSNSSNLHFIPDIFKQEYVTERPALVICRHVLEHIPQPTNFLKSIHSALNIFPNTSFFFEVPDLTWILENQAFWDFCYEHCNYFTTDSFSMILESSGFNVEETHRVFGDQYIWARGTTSNICNDNYQGNKEILDQFINKVKVYIDNENKLVSEMSDRLKELKNKNINIAIWGMATKGVIFVNLVDPEAQLINWCIDINQKKQNCFVPHTGHQIYSPQILNQLVGDDLMIVVMNPNYIHEIKATCRDLQLNARFIDANGKNV
ncbi:MAG: methyltransferase domain-containing protein [Coleofasciculaceae cyanobacterium SM2_1_6]|nr:methyltransferase domain-containing protein [Coleofasciculaceae cyanobacterium SM2_1_6]